MNTILLTDFVTYLYNNHGQFNWLGITSVVAVLSLFFTAWNDRKKFKADLISKSRIEWMNTVRPLISQYISTFSKYLYLYRQMVVEGSNVNVEVDEKMELIRKLYYELKMYIPENSSNMGITKNIDLMWLELANIINYYNFGMCKGYIKSIKFGDKESNYQKVVDEYIDNLIMQSVKDANAYFKDEWERAKSGK